MIRRGRNRLDRRCRPWAVVVACVSVLFVVSSCGALEGDTETEVGSAPASGVETDESTDGDQPVEQSDESDESDDGAAASSTTVQQESSSTTASTAPPVVEMPDLVGQTETQARTALSGLGIAEPSVETKESFEPPGTVLDQVPMPGTAVSGTVSLIVAVSVSPMPDFVDSRIADVRAWAGDRGIEVRTETELTDEIPPGQVVAQIPGPGAQVGQEIVVTVADAPVIVELADFGWLSEEEGHRGEIQMNGQIFPDTIYLRWYRASSTSRWVTYNLSRDWTTLKADLGLSDEHSARAVVQVEIKGDDEVLYSEAIAFGSLTPIEIDVTNVLRLVISATQVDGGSTRLGLGDARLIGGAPSGG